MAPATTLPVGPVLIRPANFDPRDPWEYTRLRGKVSPGMVADGVVWNRPPSNSGRPALVAPAPSLAAVSGELVVEALAAAQSAPVPAASGSALPRMSYIQAYNSIPFNRTEYEANPAYRHEAALELMFGTMRPTTIVKQTVPYFSRYPDFFRYRHSVFPYPGATGGTSAHYLYWNGLYGF